MKVRYTREMPDDYLLFLGNQRLIDIALACMKAHYEDRRISQDHDIDVDEFAEAISYKLRASPISDVISVSPLKVAIPNLKTTIGALVTLWQAEQRCSE